MPQKGNDASDLPTTWWGSIPHSLWIAHNSVIRILVDWQDVSLSVFCTDASEAIKQLRQFHRQRNDHVAVLTPILNEFIASADGVAEWRSQRASSYHELVGHIPLRWLAQFRRGLNDVFPELKSATKADDVFDYLDKKTEGGAIVPDLIDLLWEVFVHPDDADRLIGSSREEVKHNFDEKLPPTDQEIGELQSKLRQELCRAHDRRLLTGIRYACDEQENLPPYGVDKKSGVLVGRLEAARSRKLWYCDAPPGETSDFLGNGPIESSLKDMASWLDRDERTLKKGVKRGLYHIQRIERTKYNFWFSSRSTFEEVKRKVEDSDQNQTTSNSTKQHD